MAERILRKYGVQTTVDFVLYEPDGVNFKVDAAHVAGDTKIMKDEGGEANTDNAFVDRGQGYSQVISATEMEAARNVLYIADQGAKAWLDKEIIIETYGDPSAQHAFDLGTAMSGQAVASVAGAVGSVTGAVGSVSAEVSADMTKISGDATAANNLETACDGGSYNIGGGGAVAASVSGAVGSVSGAVGSVTGAVGSVAGNVDGSTASVSGAVGSVTGSVGSVAGNVDGSTASVTGAVGSVSGAVGSVTGSVGSVAGDVDGSTASVSGAVGSVAGNVGGNVTGSVGSLAAQAKTDVNAEMDDVINTDTKAELAAIPAANASIGNKIALMAMATRNGGTSTAAQIAIKKDNGTNLGTGVLSDDDTTFSRGKLS